jgi:Uma2 family endonuclease
MSRPARRIHRYTYEAYLEHEASSNVKHEYIDGDIYAMAGGTIEHAIIAVNVSSSLSAQLASAPCVVASSDLKVRVLATGLTTYPDVTVICGPPERDPRSPDVLLNPAVVVEVLSDSTEEWDQGEKLEHYQKIPSLRACVLVSHRERRVTVVSRLPDGSWQTASAGPGEAAALSAIGCALPGDGVYRSVERPR